MDHGPRTTGFSWARSLRHGADGPRGVRRVLHDEQLVPLSGLHDSRHVAGVAAVVHDQDGLGAVRDLPLNFPGQDREIMFAGDVGEYRRGPAVQDSVGSGDKGK